MKPISNSYRLLPNLSRRRFIERLVAGSVLLVFSSWLGTTQATQPAEALAGTEFNLTIAESPVNFTGAPRLATTINGSIPAPTLRWREGDTVTFLTLT
jgi:FtsP/CotA-like multicopper oxidase with cupredoxin domain